MVKPSSSKAEQTPPNRAAVRGPEFKILGPTTGAGRVDASPPPRTSPRDLSRGAQNPPQCDVKAQSDGELVVVRAHHIAVETQPPAHPWGACATTA